VSASKLSNSVEAFDVNDARPITRVAVAIIERTINGAHQLLFAQRPVGKVYAGYWEFPGGKIEAGETVIDALVREIDEELGLKIERATLWRTERFSYPHAHVELNFCRSHHWHGEPMSREGQAFSWQSPDDIGVAPLLPALLHSESQVLRLLRLPQNAA
jgi:8-oxo-dGTP diphosphatase